MSYKIQPNIFCENCIKCGRRPILEHIKTDWIIVCPNKDCDNLAVDTFIDFDAWNKKNKNRTILPGAPSKKAI